MSTEVCGLCGGSGQDPITPSKHCPKCGGIGTIFVYKAYEYRPSDSPPSNYRNRSKYKLLPVFQSLLNFLNSLPKWVNFSIAVIGCIFGIVFAQANNYANTTIWIFGAIGFILGIIFLRLTVVLVDFSLQLTMVVARLAIVLAIIGAILYLFFIKI